MIGSGSFRGPRHNGVVALPHVRRGGPRARELATDVRWFFLLAALALTAIGAGWLIATGHANYVVGVGVVTALLLAAMQAPGPLAALLLLVVLNGVPVVDLTGRLGGGIRVPDAAVIALGALLAAYRDPNPTAPRARLIRTGTIWSACFVAWWTFTLAHTLLFGGIPLLKAMLYGRDFLYFALLVPLALRARFPSRSLRAGAWLLLVAVATYALGYLFVSLTGHQLSWLVHPNSTFQTGFGVTRVYDAMQLCVNTSLIFAGALVLSKRSPGPRWLMGAFVVLLGVAAVLQLGRANYFALAVALLAGTCVYMVRYASLTAGVARGAVGILLLAAVVIAIAGNSGINSTSTSSSYAGSSAGTSSPVTGVLSRVESGFSDVSHSTGTLVIRTNTDTRLLQVLGKKWPIGLGFLNPSVRYVSDLPGGAIRNADTGVFNALMTMGIVGVILMYVPLAYGIRELLRASTRSHPRGQEVPRWIVCGGVAWITWAVTGSPTLIVLFSVPGLVLTALVLASLGVAITRRSSSPSVEPATAARPGTRNGGSGHADRGAHRASRASPA